MLWKSLWEHAKFKLNLIIILGCSKCWKEFPRELFGEKPDYSGFDYDNYRPRYGSAHKLRAKEINKSRTKTELRENESKYGVRYSELFRLEYFDPIRMHVIDPMHNLLLGTGKHMFKVWMQTGVINEKVHFDRILSLQNLIRVPNGHGRVAKNICKAFKSMKADEWKNFILIYSQFCLKNILSREQFEHWNVSVNACQILCSRVISVQEVEKAHQLLIRFGKGLESIYGKEICTPNAHLHMHLKGCINDFGPVYSFWCFSFERFNGILGSYQTNNKDISLIIMRKFCKQSLFSTMDHADYYNFVGCVKSDFSLSNSFLFSRFTSTIDYLDHSSISLKTKGKRAPLSDEDFAEIGLCCNQLYPDTELSLLKFASYYKRLNFAGDILSTNKYRKGKNTDKFFLSHHFDESGNISKNERPAVIQDILSAEIEIGSSKKNIYLAD